MTAEQALIWQEHKDMCAALGIGQSTLQHRALQGSLSSASPTGVRVYTGPDPATADPVTTDTLVWAVWQPVIMRGGTGDPETGRQAVQRTLGQMPMVDDDGNPITVSHDDTLKDQAGTEYRLLNPTAQPDQGFVTFEMLRRR